MSLECLLHKPKDGFFIPRFGDVTRENLAFVVDRTPEVHHLIVEVHVHLIKMPTPIAEATHAINAPATDFACKHWPEAVPPTAHGLVSKVVTALEQQVFHVPQTQRQTEHKASPLPGAARVQNGNTGTDWQALPSICGSFMTGISQPPKLPDPFDRTIGAFALTQPFRSIGVARHLITLCEM